MSWQDGKAKGQERGSEVKQTIVDMRAGNIVRKAKKKQVVHPHTDV